MMSTEGWIVLSTIITVTLVVVKGKQPVLAMLDARSEKIRRTLEEAEQLKAEAETLLAESQKKQRDALQTAQKIIDHAKETAVRIQEEAEENLEQSLKRREAQLLDRISRAESAAVAQIRNKAVDLATQAAGALLEDAMAKRGPKLVDEAIEEIPACLSA
ncbi:MAG: F0F1 ATP synthase subunit B [Alphaproteobacteria bacterium]|nr:F0F1 ATP synthase subunit B [Alphaproteobacteria bacterium]